MFSMGKNNLIIKSFFGVLLLLFSGGNLFAQDAVEKIEKLLEEPTAVEKFQKEKGDRATDKSGQTSPLVKESRDFALYLNPPAAKPSIRKPVVSRGKPSAQPTVAAKPSSVSVKFSVIGTSYFDAAPELSLALIDLPGKGLRWVRQGDKIGHMLLEEVKNGYIVVSDGGSKSELYPERLEKRSLVKNDSSGKNFTTGKSSMTTTLSAEEPSKPAAEVSEADRQQFIEEFTAMMKAFEEGKDPMSALEDGNDPNESTVSEKESEKLEELGDELDAEKQSPDVNSSSEEKSPEKSPPKKSPTRPGNPVRTRGRG